MTSATGAVVRGQHERGMDERRGSDGRRIGRVPTRRGPGVDGQAGWPLTAYDERPWLARYTTGAPTDIEGEDRSALAMWDAAVSGSPDAVFLRYFDASLTFREVDEISDALAVGLTEYGFARG